MDKTPNLNLNKPTYDHPADIEKLNENFDVLDGEVANRLVLPSNIEEGDLLSVASVDPPVLERFDKSAFAPADETPSVEELVAPVHLPVEAIDSSDPKTLFYPLLAAPFPLVIRQVSLVTLRPGVSTSDTDYWTVDIRRVEDGTDFSTFATKTTEATGGEEIEQYVPWTYDAVTFGSAAEIAAGDVVYIRFTASGSPDNIRDPLVTLRYEPL